MKLMPLVLTTTLSFAVISTNMVNMQTCEVRGKQYEIFQEKSIMWGNVTQTPLLGYKENL
jgi:hypothetical protein